MADAMAVPATNVSSERVTHDGGAAATMAEEPRVLDTYALFYSFTLALLVPGALTLLNLPFRTYTFLYVSLVTVPFLLGMGLVVLTDSTDPLRTKLIRWVVLTPIVVLTGVGVLFTSALFVVPASRWIVPENFGWLTWVAMGLLGVLVSPLPVALFRRLRGPYTARSIVQALFLLAGIVLVIGALYGTTQGMLTREVMRKDVIIYIIGGMTWYLPAFGIAAGVWRRMGLV